MKEEVDIVSVAFIVGGYFEEKRSPYVFADGQGGGIFLHHVEQTCLRTASAASASVELTPSAQKLTAPSRVVRRLPILTLLFGGSLALERKSLDEGRGT